MIKEFQFDYLSFAVHFLLLPFSRNSVGSQCYSEVETSP